MNEKQIALMRRYQALDRMTVANGASPAEAETALAKARQLLLELWDHKCLTMQWTDEAMAWRKSSTQARRNDASQQTQSYAAYQAALDALRRQQEALRRQAEEIKREQEAKRQRRRQTWERVLNFWGAEKRGA